MKETQKGIITENKFEDMLKEAKVKYKRNETIKTEDDIKFQIDFRIGIICIEITHQAHNEAVQKLCYRAKKLTEDDYREMMIILPINKINKRHFKMLSESYSYIYDIGDLKEAINFIARYYDLDEEEVGDIYKKMLNEKYRTYLKVLSKKNSKISEVISEHSKKIYENYIKSDSTPNNLDLAREVIQSKSSLYETSKDMDIILGKIFKNMDLAEKAKKLLEEMQKQGYFDSSSEIYKNLGLTYSQYYNNILKKLKKHGLIRKEGKFYRLDSKFSLRRIREASTWIEFAKIRRSQPKEIARVILSLFGLEDVIK